MLRTVRITYKGPQGRLSVYIPETWDTIGGSDESDDWPIMLADPISGVGILQIEVAMGKTENPLPLTIDHLTKLLFGYAQMRDYEGPFGPTIILGKQAVAQAHYRNDDEFIEFWVVSDNYNIALASYRCDWEKREVEADTRETIVRGVEFDNIHRPEKKKPK